MALHKKLIINLCLIFMLNSLLCCSGNQGQLSPTLPTPLTPVTTFGTGLGTSFTNTWIQAASGSSGSAQSILLGSNDRLNPPTVTCWIKMTKYDEVWLSVGGVDGVKPFCALY